MDGTDTCLRPCKTELVVLITDYKSEGKLRRVMNMDQTSMKQRPKPIDDSGARTKRSIVASNDDDNMNGLYCTNGLTHSKYEHKHKELRLSYYRSANETGSYKDKRKHKELNDINIGDKDDDNNDKGSDIDIGGKDNDNTSMMENTKTKKDMNTRTNTKMKMYMNTLTNTKTKKDMSKWINTKTKNEFRYVL
ncbi:hypothetical protein RFI_23283 [Reticulomyxa filosa]|uniref:Uncharacterized protein n=1 Tax=Reticulomyxa filosa TaxID=46433 RepID=X6MLX3_RETFI|nr:hypothetical protein RFI_23283 [Reticulomyxa filosa]|eukprot:ETO14085.1 hypothetical protein RFI_23283 [Reticulomyxa filosa]